MAYPQRCGRCQACQELDRLKPAATPNPPFTHASDGLVQVWNTNCLTHMCETWTEEEQVKFYERLSELPSAIRPPPLYLEEVRVKLKLEGA